jgi:hypothetical protein
MFFPAVKESGGRGGFLSLFTNYLRFSLSFSEETVMRNTFPELRVYFEVAEKSIPTVTSGQWKRYTIEAQCITASDDEDCPGERP